MSNLHCLPVQALNAIFDSLLSQMPLIFWMRTPDYKTQIFVSEHYEAVWGSPTSNLYEHPASFDDFICPNDMPKFDNVLSKRLLHPNEAQENSCEFRIINGQKEIRWITDRSFPVFDHNKNLVAIAGLCEDITALKKNNIDLCSDYNLQERPKQLWKEINEALEREYQLRLNEPSPLMTEIKIQPNQYYTINNQRVKFTAREADCLNVCIYGHSAKIIGDMLGISPRTVEEYLLNARKKTKARNKMALINQITSII